MEQFSEKKDPSFFAAVFAENGHTNRKNRTAVLPAGPGKNHSAVFRAMLLPLLCLAIFLVYSVTVYADAVLDEFEIGEDRFYSNHKWELIAMSPPLRCVSVGEARYFHSPKSADYGSFDQGETFEVEAVYEDGEGVLWGIFSHYVGRERRRALPDGGYDVTFRTEQQYDWVRLRDVCPWDDQTRNAEEVLRGTLAMNVPKPLGRILANRTLVLIFAGAVFYIVLVVALIMFLKKKKRRKTE